MQEEYKQIEIIRNIKNSAPFTDCKTEIDNKDNTKDLNFVISMYNLIEYSDNSSLTTGRSWQYHKDQPKDLRDESD